ncbi:MAG: phospholipase D-like domain-containing protein [Nanoarchaeota archaeon]|nr:phospholipase D-like domain-containing protein [Nanoarchaeota archaeon]
MGNIKTRLIIFFIIFVLFFTLLPTPTNSKDDVADATVNMVKAERGVPVEEILIVEVYYDTYLSYEPEEYVTIFNRGAGAVNVTGWNITDQEGTVTFPGNTNTTLFPGDCFFVTGNATAFKEETGRVADFEYAVDSDPGVPQMILSGSLVLANTGDEVLLKNQTTVVDVIIYGTSTYSGEGWTGTTVAGVTEGHVLKRNRNETTNQYIDTNTSSDWTNIRGYWVGQSDFSYQTYNFTGNVTVFSSPDSSYQTIINVLDNATTSIFLNVYEFTNPYLSQRLVNASNRGVDVKVFLEGGPVGGLTNESKWIARQLYENGTDVRFMITNDTLDIHDRYSYNHAKYCIIDNQTVFLTSENWKYTGIPVNNTFGNRGWGIVIRNSSVAHYFSDVFFEDYNSSRKDSYPYTPGDPKYGEPPPGYEIDKTIPTNSYPQNLFPAETIIGNFTVSPVLCPDTSTLQTKSIIGMINSAQYCVYIEQMNCDKNWTWYGDYHPNLYLEAAINASRRGCKVRVLLDSAYNWSDTGNWETVLHLRNISRDEGLDLQAKLINLSYLKVDKIHNKGVIVDCNKTLISSINWGYNSVTNNRETGVIVENKKVAEFYTKIFMYDWNTSTTIINLTTGWNLITPSLAPYTIFTAEQLAGNIINCTHITTWNNTKQNFTSYTNGTNENNFDIKTGNGYMVYVTSNSMFTVQGDVFVNVTMQLKTGWNSIGRFNGTTINASSLAAEIGNCTSVAYWNSTLGRYITHPVNTSLSDFVIRKNMGYMIWVTTDKVWLNQ